MSTETEYFILVAILFASYVGMRFAVVWYAQHLPDAPEEPDEDYTGKGIETGELSDRVHRVRESWNEPKPALQANSFKRELMVASKREEMAKLAFFQNPPAPPPEPQEEEHGFHLLMA